MLTEADVRRIALSMPEAVEAPHFEATSFRVNGKIFCTLGEAGERAVLKFDPEDQHNLISDDPDVLTPIPGAWGRRGWTQVSFSRLDEARLEGLIRLSWATVAPNALGGVQRRKKRAQ